MSGGAARATTRAVGRAPIAAMSDRFVAAAFQPRSCGVDHARRKSGPCTMRVGRDHIASVGRGEHGGVVAGADQGDRGIRQPREDAAQHRGLAELAEGRVRSAARQVAVHVAHASLRAMKRRTVAPLGCGGAPVAAACSPDARRSSRCSRPTTRTTPTAPPSSCGCPTGRRAAKRQTDAQATGGVGRTRPVVLPCGVAVPAASELPCIDKGVFWLRDDSNDAVLAVHHFGRDPAVESIVDRDIVSGPGVVLDDLRTRCRSRPRTG